MGSFVRFVSIVVAVFLAAMAGVADEAGRGPSTPPDLLVGVTTDAPEIVIGDSYLATTTVSNQGSAVAAGPIELTMWGSFMSLSGLTVTPSSDGSCSRVDSDWVCIFPNALLPANNRIAVVEGGTNALGEVTIFALANAANGDLDPADNYASATTPVVTGDGVEFLVTSTVDDVDAMPGDGVCSSPGGLCTLRAAVMESNALEGPNTVTIMVAGTITVDAVVWISHDLTIRSGLSGNAVVSGGDLHLIFLVGGSAYPNIAFESLDLVHGNGSTAGAVNLDGAGAVSFSDCRIANNTSTSGGAVTVGTWSGNLLFDRCAFADNSSATSGAAVAIQGDPFDQRGTLEIRQSIFNTNVSGASSEGGGAIAVLTTDWDLVITDTSFIGNIDPVEGGGAIALSGSSIDPITARIERSSFLDNLGHSGGGGAIVASWAELELVNCTFAGNAASVGGAVSVSGGSLALSQTTFTLNTATTSGGAVNVGVGTVALAASTVFEVNSPSNCAGAGSLTGDHNLSSDASCSFSGSGNLVSTSALLGPPVCVSGGLVYYPPQAGSPALDSAGAGPCLDAFGDEVDDDVIGNPRPADGSGDGVVGCDRGAVEVVSPLDIFADGFENGSTSTWSGTVG